MNYDEPRQREQSGRWDMTSRNDDKIRPIGYCAGWDRMFGELESPRLRQSLIDQHGENLVAMLDQSREVALPFQAHYHTDGHATCEEAEACYRGFLLDQRTRYNSPLFAIARCEIEGCGLETRTCAQVGSYEVHFLCELHQTREHLAPRVNVCSIHT